MRIPSASCTPTKGQEEEKAGQDDLASCSACAGVRLGELDDVAEVEEEDDDLLLDGLRGVVVVSFSWFRFCRE